MILLDSNILIDYFRGVQKVKDFIAKYGKSHFAVSIIVSMELYQGSLNKAEYAYIKKELKGFYEIGLNEKIGEIALQLSQQFALSHKMGVPDTLIAATALVYDLELRTLNLKDFRFIPSIKVSNELV
jgi:tRNA(fMet)-specific endonuclease VapC